MKQIQVILNVDEDAILKEADQSFLEDAITQELGWLHDSGMSVESWSFNEPEDKAAAELSNLSKEGMEDPEQSSTKSLALALYVQMDSVLRKNADAFYIARNLEFLSRCVEEEVTEDQFYRLAERHREASGSYFTQPFLSEERLDAIRTLLENGMSSDRDACLGDLDPQQTLEFLLTCDGNAFAFAVEETAASNQEKYAPEQSDRFGAKAFKKAMKEFLASGEKHALKDMISSAEARTSQASPSQSREKELDN